MFQFIVLHSAAVTFSGCVGGFTAYDPPGGSVHALCCVKVNEIMQEAATTAAGGLSHTHTPACLFNRDSVKLERSRWQFNSMQLQTSEELKLIQYVTRLCQSFQIVKRLGVTH